MRIKIKNIFDKISDFLDGDEKDNFFVAVFKLILRLILFLISLAFLLFSGMFIFLAPFATTSAFLEHMFPTLVENGGVMKDVVYYSILAIVFIGIYLFYKNNIAWSEESTKKYCDKAVKEALSKKATEFRKALDNAGVPFSEELDAFISEMETKDDKINS